jgi:DNA-binding NarL/FixJ family response regulator
MIKVLIADDQALVRTGFRMILDAEADIEVTGEAADGLEAIAAAKSARPDVILMDVRMPNMNGIEATRQLVDKDDVEPIRILILTTFDLDEYVYDALRAGASGFLLKDAPPEELVHAVRVVERGDALIAPSITKRLIEEISQRPAQQGAPPETLETLTQRELEVLQLMARGLSNHEIAQELFVSDTTVKTHVGRVLMKLGLRDRVQAVVLAYESGVVRPGVG